MKKIRENIAEAEARLKELKKERDEAKAKPTAEPDSIICSTTPKGFTFNYNADSRALLKHTVSTIKEAFEELDGIDKVMLAMQVMELLSKLAEAEKEKCTK